MPNPKSPVPFVTNFLRPLVSQQDKQMLLIYECDDGSKGCLGLHDEAIKSLQEAIATSIDSTNHIGCSFQKIVPQKKQTRTNATRSMSKRLKEKKRSWPDQAGLNAAK